MASKEKLKAIIKAAGKEEKSLARKIMESSLYDWNPSARLLLNQLAVMAMGEDSNYPDDAPEAYKADKEGWCWLSQFKLSLRVGVTEDHIQKLLKMFREVDGVIQRRQWIDDNMTTHSEYKVVESVVDAFQRPNQNRGVERPPRYKKVSSTRGGAGRFSTKNQPSRVASEVAAMDEE